MISLAPCGCLSSVFVALAHKTLPDPFNVHCRIPAATATTFGSGMLSLPGRNVFRPCLLRALKLLYRDLTRCALCSNPPSGVNRNVRSSRPKASSRAGDESIDILVTNLPSDTFSSTSRYIPASASPGEPSNIVATTRLLPESEVYYYDTGLPWEGFK